MSNSACCKEMCDELEDEFEKPVETIMKCDEFKSNFARRLSNRFGVRPPVTDRNDEEVQKPPTELNVPDSPVKSANLPETNDAKKTCPKDDVDSTAVEPKSPEINTSINKTEVTNLNRKVATLNWQLDQVESNRQIHTSLLKQIVIFLNRVKDHLENQEAEKKDTELPMSASGDLPRSYSVVHVNKNSDHTLMPANKSASKKLSKSIGNVNRFKEYNNWDSSKSFVNIDTNPDKKIVEEMKRLIILATTLLNTKIPNLASQFGNAANTGKDIPKMDVALLESYANKELNLQKPNKTELHAVPDFNINRNKRFVDDGAEAGCSGYGHSLAPPQEFHLGIRSSMSSLDLLPIERNIQDDDSYSNPGPSNRHDRSNELGNDNKNGMEDESGFSSLNSLQEIGIPIINIIPATPEEDLLFVVPAPVTNGYGPHPPEADPSNVFWV